MDRLLARLDAAIAAWNGGDLETYLDLYDPAIRLHGYTPEPMDKAAASAFYRMIFDTLTPSGDPAPRIERGDALADGPRRAFAFTMAGAHTGSFMGIPASGRSFRIGGMTILTFGDRDTVVERLACADMLGLLVQIGAAPPPPS